jgi:uncharacterized protein (DUF1810 family)
MTADDPFDLRRFTEAQAPLYEQICTELRSGRKRSHWMWFTFPQIAGLGQSPMAIRFAISSLQEAQAYLNHAVLGPRLRECTHLVSLIEGCSIRRIFGEPDDLKFRSSMTLFAVAASENRIFQDALKKYFDGVPDRLTIERLSSKTTA